MGRHFARIRNISQKRIVWSLTFGHGLEPRQARIPPSKAVHAAPRIWNSGMADTNNRAPSVDGEPKLYGWLAGP
jgi:hypothetical protein